MRRIVGAGIGAVLLLSAAAILFFTLRAPRLADAGFQAVLDALDSAISGGYISTAQDTLASLRTLPSTEAVQLRLLKRAFQVARATGGYEQLAEMAGRTLAASGRSQRIRAVAAYANLRAGRLAEAERILGRNAAAGPGAESLRGETRMRRGVPWSGSDDLTRELLSLEKSTDPARYTAAALRADEKRLSLDGALLAMQHGSPATALRIVADDLAEPRFDEAAGPMLYDGGDFSAAAARLKRLDAARPGNPAVGLQIADIYAAAGNGDQAEMWILHALPLAPALSWTPYGDLAFFSLSRGDLQAASRRLDDGLAFFPASRELRLMKARVAAQAGDVRSAEALLSGLLADRPGDTEAALLLLTLQGPELSPEAARARLWKLFDLVPNAPAVYDALASSLITARDWDGLAIALRQFQASGGQPDARLLAFQGFASAMRGDDAGAIADFRRSAFLARDGSARFDIALVMLRQGGARAALSELDSAEAEVMARTEQEGRPGMLSRIETLRGAARLLDGDIPGAGSALTHALALDPRNLRAGLLLRKLEAGGQ